MKKFEYLALKSHEFLDMLEAIARERTTIRVKKRDDKDITLTCQIAIPMAQIKYHTEEQGDNLNVYRRINWFPLVYSTIPILALLEAIMFLITYFNDNIQWFSYLLVGLAWLLGIVFILYQIFSDLENLTQKLFKVKV
ncbi:MAG: hypothetical protein GOP50_02900 [Candidatus Heimdallarchaeota archaeon]|nr:hypothetical protein [Candidatus Heimdallarchaeota archaeon]